MSLMLEMATSMSENLPARGLGVVAGRVSVSFEDDSAGAVSLAGSGAGGRPGADVTVAVTVAVTGAAATAPGTGAGGRLVSATVGDDGTAAGARTEPTQLLSNFAPLPAAAVRKGLAGKKEKCMAAQLFSLYNILGLGRTSRRQATMSNAMPDSNSYLPGHSALSAITKYRLTESQP